MARNIKNKEHSKYAIQLNFLKGAMQDVLISIAYNKNLLTAEIDAKKKGQEIDEADIVYHTNCLKWDRNVYHKIVKEIRHTKKMMYDASHYQV